MSVSTNPTDPDIADTPFYKALRWRVHDPDEALEIAATHRRRAAEERLGYPGQEVQAARHDRMAAICEEHAATLAEDRAWSRLRRRRSCNRSWPTEPSCVRLMQPLSFTRIHLALHHGMSGDGCRLPGDFSWRFSP